MRRRLLVVADRPQDDDWWQVAEAIIDHLARHRGWKLALLVWDRSDLPRSSVLRRRVREIESINRWRLPQVLERLGWRTAMRKLRHIAIRWWWMRWGRPDAALIVGPLRPEAAHYLPPGEYLRAALLDDVCGPDLAVTRSAVTRQLARVLLPPPSSARDVRVMTGAWDRDRRRLRFGLRPSSIVVGGFGPSADDPFRGLDRFLRAFWRLRECSPGVDLQALWVGTDSSPTSVTSLRHTLWRLDLGDDVVVLSRSVVGSDLHSAIDVLALTARGRYQGSHLHDLRAAGVSIVRFDRVEATDGFEDHTCAYGDVEALARRLSATVDHRLAERASTRKMLADLEQILG